LLPPTYHSYLVKLSEIPSVMVPPLLLERLLVMVLVMEITFSEGPLKVTLNDIEGILTVTGQVAVIPASWVVTVIIAVPLATAVTVPSLSTVATPGLVLPHIKVLFVALSGVSVAVSFPTGPPTVRSRVSGARVTPVTGVLVTVTFEISVPDTDTMVIVLIIVVPETVVVVVVPVNDVLLSPGESVPGTNVTVVVVVLMVQYRRFLEKQENNAI
jgi:hypothetical protein